MAGITLDPADAAELAEVLTFPTQSGFLSNFRVSLLCSNSVRTRAARAMAPISLGLAVTC
jgi:hypothetical protein